MRSKTSCFNGPLFRKNLTRFAPAWGLYTLCLVLGIGLMYHNGGTSRQFHFGANLAELVQVMGMINLIYAPLVAQLLFGDLYNSRMCYALHAMPVRRESLFLTNILSGLTFSVLPTAVMTLLSLLLMRSSIFTQGWMIPLYVFAGINLEFICFFGIAVFAALCTGNRFAMATIYGLVNFGAYIAYWLIDTVYTPMLYGVVTPSTLAENLTPVVRIVNYAYMETDSYYELRQLFPEGWEGATANFTLTENWGGLLLWAAAGLAFLLLALVLYRKRNLECAGDAMAFKGLEPVFQVLGALVTAAAAQFFVAVFLSFGDQYSLVFLTFGLVVGWFACRMLIDRSTRVFGLRNWLGLGALTGLLALSLLLTHIDILGIETWMPRAEAVASVRFQVVYGYPLELKEPSDIEAVLRVQEIALKDRLEQAGPYVENPDGSCTYAFEYHFQTDTGKEVTETADCVYAADVHIAYTLKNGKEVRRNYVIWVDGETGRIAREYASRWEVINGRYAEYDEPDRLALVLDSLEEIHVDGAGMLSQALTTPETAQSLLEALRADAAEGNLVQHYYFHRGRFLITNDDIPSGSVSRSPDLWLSLYGKEDNWSITVYPDSAHTIKWLQEHDLLAYEIEEGSYPF